MNKKQKTWIDDFIKAAGLTPIVKRNSAEWIDGKLIPCDLVESFVRTLDHNVNNRKNRMDGSTKQRRDMVRELERLQAAIEGLSVNTRELLARNSTIMFSRPIALPMDGEGSLINALSDGVITSIDQCDYKAPRGDSLASGVKKMFVIEAAEIFLMIGGKTLSPDADSCFSLFLTELDKHCNLGLHDSQWRNAVNEALGEAATARRKYKQKILKRLAQWQ